MSAFFVNPSKRLKLHERSRSLYELNSFNNIQKHAYLKTLEPKYL